MKILVALSALAIAALSTLPAVAGDADERYFSWEDRIGLHPWGLAPIDGRYPRPAELDLIAGAGEPVPVDPFTLPRPYYLGEAWVPLTVTRGGKGHVDAKGRAAWDSGSERMSFGN